MPRKEYLTNFTIDDIILIDEKIIDIDIINNPSNKITQIEYSKNIDSSSAVEYTGNNLVIDNKTFCIFTFDIMQNLITSDGYTVYDQKKFLLKGNYELEESHNWKKNCHWLHCNPDFAHCCQCDELFWSGISSHKR